MIKKVLKIMEEEYFNNQLVMGVPSKHKDIYITFYRELMKNNTMMIKRAMEATKRLMEDKDFLPNFSNYLCKCSGIFIAWEMSDSACENKHIMLKCNKCHKKILHKDKLFHDHIKSHFEKDHPEWYVCCKLCGETYDDIVEGRKQSLRINTPCIACGHFHYYDKNKKVLNCPCGCSEFKEIKK